ncbi:MAG: hypothetical protein P8L68_07660 [Paracoccaceae bacterium]|nr:hypothetical protein [Paracoccaceae bacterium]MDG2258353.1 hypothetical protein [Paracoccaceae bacterium]
MKSTRGRKSGFLVQKVTTAERKNLDRTAFPELSKDILDGLEDVIAGARARGSVDYFSNRTEEGKKIANVQKSAKKFLKSLDELGPDYLPNFDIDKLDEDIRNGFRRGRPASVQETLICEVGEVFEKFGKGVTISTSSTFVLALTKISIQFPELLENIASEEAFRIKASRAWNSRLT